MRAKLLSCKLDTDVEKVAEYERQGGDLVFVVPKKITVRSNRTQCVLK
jgi:hypothetical protein